jgi:hypothetical protein
MPDDDWKPDRVNGPDDNNNDDRSKAVLVFLPVPDELKQKGVKAITYARTFISIDYKGKIFSFTVYKEDVTKTHGIYEKELDHEFDDVTKHEIWFCIASNWLKAVYTEEEIQRDAIGAIGGQADAILDIAKRNCQQIFKDEYNIAYAAVTINDHLEILPINESRFKHWLRKTVSKEYEVIVRSQLLDEVVNSLTSDAVFDGEARELGLRIAPAPEDNLGLKLRWYYDLTNDANEFVEITSEGWKIRKNEIIFRRFDHQKPQDYPEPNYPSDIFDQFMDLLNVKKENRLILKCYIISLFIPNLPKAVLMVHGEQGTAKSMLQELIKMLVDPNVVKTLSFPKDVAELVQQLSHHSVTYYDNLSIIPGWISDLLCRATTGSGFSKRRLYTNDQDVVYSLMRAIGFNGINLAATKPDLLDRGLIIQTETIPKGNRRRMRAIWNKFNSIRPYLLAYILDILVKVLNWKKENPSLDLIKELPRMADWAEWCEVISRCMGEEDDAFMNAYNENINLQVDEVIEGSDLAIAVLDFVERFDGKEVEFNGTSTELLVKLNLIADVYNVDKRNKYWPKSAPRLSRSLKLLQRTLREVGIEIRWYKDTSTRNNTRKIVIRKLPSEPSEPSNNPKSCSKSVDKSDGRNSSDSNLSSEKELSSNNKNENRAQNGLSDGRTASDDTLDIIQNSNPKIDVRKLVKCDASENKLVYDADPATGGPIFQNKETVLELNGCRVEVFLSDGNQ